MPMVDDALAAIQDAFRQCRPLILARAGKVAHTDKQDGSPVTETDVAVEKILFEVMAQRMPGMPVFGEETGYGNDLPAAFWLVDPIDGTPNFIQNIPIFTSMGVMIAGGEAVACAIYNIAADTMYVAQKGKGAYKNGVRLDLTATPLPAVAHCKGRLIEPLDELLHATQVHCENAPVGGGYGFSLVADGKSAARFNLLGAGYIHDYAPGALLVREAGGVILPVGEDEYTYKTRSFIACHPELAPVLRPHLHELRALEQAARTE